MKVCVVTDIHNQPNQEQCLSSKLTVPDGVIRFALNELCGRQDLTGEALHRHLFDYGGMHKAVDVLSHSLNGDFFGLGYSAGGTAIWRAAATKSSFAAIFCVSSTRLRDEASIATPNHVFFGSEDQNRPSPNWITTVPDRSTVFDGVGHNYYRDLASGAAYKTCALISQAMQGLSEAP